MLTASTISYMIYSIYWIINFSPVLDVEIVTEIKSKRSYHINLCDYSLSLSLQIFTNNFDGDNRGIFYLCLLRIKMWHNCIELCFFRISFLKIQLDDINKCLVIGCVYWSPSSTAENDDLLNKLINTAFITTTIMLTE